MIAALLVMVATGQVRVSDEGVAAGLVNRIDCVGAGIACTVTGSTATFTANGGGGGGGAPTDATYITQTPNATLSAEQPLSLLSTGILKVTTTTGALTTAIAADFPTLNQSTTGNAATATALAADPADCSGNSFALGIGPSGTAACAQPSFANLSGAATIAQGGTTETASTEDAVLVGAGTTDWAPKVLPSCSNATTSKLLYDSSTNAFSCGTDQTGAGGGEVNMPHYGLTRAFGFCRPLTTAATAFTCAGMTALTAGTGTATAQPALTGAVRMNVRWAQAAATINTDAGLVGGPFAETRPLYRPKFVTTTIFDAVDNRRAWFGLFESTPMALTGANGPTASAVDFVGVVLDTSIGTGFRCCSGDGTNYSCSDVGVTPAANTHYAITVDWTVAGTLTCTVNSTSVNKTTNLSTAAVGLGVIHGMRTLTAAIRNHHAGKITLEQN